MTAVLKRLATAFGVSLAVVVTVVYNLPDGTKPATCVQHLTRAPVLITRDGGEAYRTLKLPLLRCDYDGGTVERLPSERVMSCLASVRFDGMPLQRADNCARGTVEPTSTVEFVPNAHDTPDSDCSDDEACADGGFALGADQCACSTGMGCEALASDGGWVTAPTGVTLPEGQWRGSGCVEKVCVERLGTSSWPGGCP